jgi:hypothetical protein
MAWEFWCVCLVLSDLAGTNDSVGQAKLNHPYDLDLNVDEIASEIRTITGPPSGDGSYGLCSTMVNG